MRKVILASSSPRRSELLRQAGIDFSVLVPEVDETTEKSVPGEVVEALARIKAEAAFEKAVSDEKYNMRQAVVLGADTIVAFDSAVLGKPADKAAAKESLKMLSGKKHDVYTGVCIIGCDENGEVFKKIFSRKTSVKMKTLDEKVIDWYISTGEPMDKAGAYGIQGFGAVLVDSICGDYNNVVGLPLADVWQYLYYLS